MSGGAAPALTAQTVTVGTVGSASANLWPAFIGINKGLFAEEDIKLDLVFVQSSAAMVQQLTAGSLDVTLSTGLVDPIRAIDKGAPLAIVRFESQSAPYALLGRPEIVSLAGLRGKTISVGGAKDITRIFLERMLAPSGVRPGEFNMVYAGATAARAAALLSGAVDAAIVLPPFNFRASGRDRGFVFQNDNLLPWRDVFANAFIGHELAGRAGAAESSRVRDLLRLVGLGGFEGYFPRQLSGGMRQRVNLARALAINSDILLMDGELIRDLHETPRLRKQSIAELVFAAVDEEGGPLIDHGASEDQQRAFDATCRKLYRSLKGSNSSCR